MPFYVLNQIKPWPAPLSLREPEELQFPTRVPAASIPSPATLNSPDLQSLIIKEKKSKERGGGRKRLTCALQAVIFLKGGWMHMVILT